MIEIARHLEILLLDNDCVIVPGLGGFMAHSVHASYSEEEQLFLPPCRMLGFNPLLRINDSLLAQSYVEAYDLSYPEALRRIEGEVNELQQHLANEGSYSLENVGRLSVNAEGHLEFEPYEAGIFTPALYGLCPFEMPLQGSAVPAEDNAAPAVAVFNPQVEKSMPEHENSDDCESDVEAVDAEKAIVIKMSWIRNAVAIAAALIAFLLMSPTVSNDQQGGLNMSAVPVPIIPMSETSNQSLTFDLQQQDSTLVEQPEPEKPDTVSVQAEHSAEFADDSPGASEPEAYYCIVLASHVSQRNAELFVQSLHKDGFTEARIIEHHNIRRVVYGSYGSEQEAYNELRADRKSHFFEEAWVYHVK